MKKIFSIVFLMIVLASCEKTVTVEIPQRNPRLVINAWMEKGAVIEAMIGKSRNVLQPLDQTGSWNESYVVKNAVPVVYENNIAIDTLVYQSSTFKYISVRNKIVRDGYHYTIRVSAPGFTAAESSTVVPSQSVIAGVSRVRNARSTSNSGTQDEVTIKLDDPAGESNFYLLQFFPANYASGTGYPIYCVSTTDKDLEAIGDNADPFSTENCFDGGSLLMKDVNFNGRQKTLRFYINSYDLNDIILPGGGTARPYVRVHRITEDYFKYVKSYNVYYNASDNPFAEPSNVFSNVKNGYGIFSAYTVASDTLR
jgi:hypothetical protein